jgi:hypothetical protein
MKNVVLLVTALGGLAAALWLLPRGERSLAPGASAALAASVLPPPALPAAEASVAELQPPARDLVATSTTELAEAAMLPSARQYLEGYYGADWPAIQARIEAAGGELDVPYTPHPWEEARERMSEHALLDEGTRDSVLRGFMDWPEPLSNEWLETKFGRDPGLAPAEFDELAALVATDTLALETAARTFADLLDQEVRLRWEQGRYFSAPFTTQGLSDARGFYSKGFGGLGWSVVITMTYEECPELESLKQEMAGMRLARDRRVLDFLQARMRR